MEKYYAGLPWSIFFYKIMYIVKIYEKYQSKIDVGLPPRMYIYEL
jgi:hypothetical protein